MSENPDEKSTTPECPHAKTVKKFSGAELCDHCGEHVGTWSAPPPKLRALRHPDGTFEIA